MEEPVLCCALPILILPASCPATSIPSSGNSLVEGANVKFEKSWDDRKGKHRAENVTGGVTTNDRGGGGGGYGGDRGGGDRYGGGGGGARSSGACFDFQKVSYFIMLVLNCPDGFK